MSVLPSREICVLVTPKRSTSITSTYGKGGNSRMGATNNQDNTIRRLLVFINGLISAEDGADRKAALVGVRLDEKTVMLDLNNILKHWNDLCIHYTEATGLLDSPDEADVTFSKRALRAHKQSKALGSIGREPPMFRCSKGEGFIDKQTGIYTLAQYAIYMIDNEGKLTRFRATSLIPDSDSDVDRQEFVRDVMLDAIKEATEQGDDMLANKMEAIMKIVFG